MNLTIKVNKNNEIVETPIIDFKEYAIEKYNDWEYVKDILIDMPYFIENMFFKYFEDSYDFKTIIEEFKIITALEATMKNTNVLEILREEAIEIHNNYDLVMLDRLNDNDKFHCWYHTTEAMKFITRIDNAYQYLLNKEVYNYRPKINNSNITRVNNMKFMINDFSDSDKQFLLKSFDNKCALTGREHNIEMDHVIPISWRIEGTTLSNMLPLEKTLNISKGNKNIFEWYEEKKKELGINEDMFINALTYIAELNDMNFYEYKKYVYESHRRMLEIKFNKIKDELEKVECKLSEMD